jgi:hypothetical protein
MSGSFNVRENALRIGKEYFHLEDFVAIFVPSTKNIEEKISPEEIDKYRNQVIDKLNKICGGSTAIIGKGSFQSKELDKRIDEEVLIASAFVNIQNENKVIQLFQFTQQLCHDMSQESIGLIIGDCLFFVKN